MFCLAKNARNRAIFAFPQYYARRAGLALESAHPQDISACSAVYTLLNPTRSHGTSLSEPERAYAASHLPALPFFPTAEMFGLLVSAILKTC